MPKREIIHLTVSKQDDDELKICWLLKGYPCGPYAISLARMENLAIECRQKLEALTKLFLEAPNPDYTAALHNLAATGSGMFYELFGGNDPSRTASQAQNHLANAGANAIIRVGTDSSCHIPWALVCDANLKPKRDKSSDVGNFGCFWGLRHSVSVLYGGMDFFDFRRPRSRVDYKMMFVLNAQEIANLRPYLSAEEDRYFTDLISADVGDVDSWDDAETKWQTITHRDSLIFVYCHSNGLNLRLEDTDINVSNFERTFRKRSSAGMGPSSSSLYFLNGCSTANGNKDNGFASASVAPGFCGFIGTEAKVPSEFAMRFGMAFLYHLVERGWRVQDIMDKLRVKHWPLSLLYTNCAHPDYYVEPSQDDARTLFEESKNYSSQPFRLPAI